MPTISVPKKTVWDKVENHLIKWLIGTAGATVLLAIAFYFNTNMVLAQNTESINSVKADMKTIKNVPVINQTKIENVERTIKELKVNQHEFQQETKLSINDLRRQNLKMLELLYQIKQQNVNK